MKKVTRIFLIVIFLGLFYFTLQAVPAKAETSLNYNSQLASLLETLSQMNKLFDQLKAIIAENPNINPQSHLAAVILTTDTNIVAHWKLDEGSGTTASDSSGNGNNGVLVNGPVWTIGKVGNALSFDGINDKVSVASGSSINNLTAMTVSGWIYPKSSGGGGFARIIRKGNTTTPDGTNMYWEIFTGSNTLHFRAGYSTSFGDWIVSGIPFNQWTYVAVTYTHGNISADPLIYINGVLQTTAKQTAPAGTKLSDTSSLTIGDWGNGSRVFDGVVDEIRVFSRLLSAGDINALYSADLGGLPDTTPPIISGVSASSITSNGATIGWSTDELSSAQVEYGLTTSYGSLTPEDVSLATSHTMVVSGLSPGTLYHYRVKSKDTAGNLAMSPDSTFSTSAAVSDTRPNIVVIMTDDQDDTGSMNFLPKTKSLIADKGMKFTNSFVDFPLCCPSRATFLTGQDSHNHGVLGNADESSGGYAKLLPTANNTLPVWLQNAGYNTALIGKYLNGYGIVVPQTNIPPGWNKWVGIVENSNYITYYNYTLNDSGSLHTYGSMATDYQTDVLAQKASDYIASRSESSQPFFLWLTPFAPHADRTDTSAINSPIPALRYAGTLSSVPLPTPPNFNEADISDKPAYVGTWPFMDSTGIINTQNAYHKHLETLLAVDDMVEKVMNSLQTAGKLDNTIIVYTSDNGYFQGEHRKPVGKYWLYEPSLRVPFVIRGPGISVNTVQSQLVTNVDLASTVLDYAGAVPGRTQDGKSLKPILSGSTPSWRNGFFFQGIDVVNGTSCGEACPRFNAIRTSRYVYAEHATGEKELYDLAVDPYQLASKHNDPAYSSVKSFFASKLAVLKTCVGSGCWYTDADPLPGVVTTTVTLSASPTTITSGGSATLTWSSTNATSCTASGAWSGTKATSGTQIVSPTITSTYTLTCTGSGGSITQSATVTVTAVITSTKFNIGDRVQTTAVLNVRATPPTSGILLGTQTVGALGTIISGPTAADGYNWWQVNYDTGVDGWSVENYLTKYTTEIVAHWKFDGDATDASGNGNNGILVNGPVWTAGKINGALSFDGINDQVKVTTSGSVNGLANITVSAWIYPRSGGASAYGRILEKGTTTSRRFDFHTSINGVLTFRVPYTTQWGVWRTPLGSIKFNQWQHVAVTYAFGSVNKPTLYIDGVAQSLDPGTFTNPIGSPPPDNNSLTIGDLGDGSRVFDGIIDDVRIYKGILGPTDIATLSH